MIIWLSFCDPDKPSGQQFLGGVFVEILDRGEARANTKAAIEAAWFHGVNPGGEVLAVDCPPEKETLARPYLHRLMQSEELKAVFAQTVEEVDVPRSEFSAAT